MQFAYCLAGDNRNGYIHTMKPPEVSPVYGTEIYPKKYEIETLMCLVSTTASSSVPSRPQHYIKQAERHLLCLTSSCLNNWMMAATYDRFRVSMLVALGSKDLIKMRP